MAGNEWHVMHSAVIAFSEAAGGLPHLTIYDTPFLDTQHPYRYLTSKYSSALW